MTGDDEAEEICQECGNDLVCEGYHLCSECLESINPDGCGDPTCTEEHP